MTTSTELVPVNHTPVAAERSVSGTVDLRGGELIVRVRPDDYRDATTRPVRRVDPMTLAGVACMSYVGPCVGADAARVYRTVEFCRRHPVLAWLRGWTRR